MDEWTMSTTTDNESTMNDDDRHHDEKSKAATANNDEKEYFQEDRHDTVVDYYDYTDPLAHLKHHHHENGDGTEEDSGPVPANTTQMTYNQETTKEDSDTTASMISMMKEVNDQLEAALEQSKQSVKRILKELVAFHEVSMTTLNEWKPIRDAEQQEAHRLEQLQTEVQGATSAFTPASANPMLSGMHPAQQP
jgi:hypothetical protein